METVIRKINIDSLKEAKKLLLNGEAVAFPTETVYGLGADARSDTAVEGIYKIKGRPSDNPLIVHVHKDYDINSLVFDDSVYAKKLRDKFLPGPLTLVYRSRNVVSNKVSCGLDTLAIRIPSHEGAQKFLSYVDIPVAAPSANLSKHVSPVSAMHVYDDLKERIHLILDGGPCLGGIESTVCDVTGGYPVILREGLISREMIETVVGKCELYIPQDGEQVRSPGMKYKHYAPSCKTTLFNAGELDNAIALYRELNDRGIRVYVLCEDIIAKYFPRVLNMGKTEYEMAANLYRLLREGESVAQFIIAVEPKNKNGIMAGVINRLHKACAEDKE